MRIHPRKIIPIILVWTLVVIILTAIATQVLAQPEEVIRVEYVLMNPQEYEEAYPEEAIEAEELEESTEEQVFPMETLGVYNVSAYCPCEECCGPYADGYTSIGVKAVEGVTIAADPKVLPEGTEIFIEGIGWRTVQDTGGAIKGKRLDIFFGGPDGHQRALEFGRQYLNVYKEVE